MFLRIKRYAVIALSVVGSATLLFSCGKKPNTTSYDNETLMTESSENRTITMMENGKRSYTFTSPLMEGYRLATNPYQEFRRGIEMTTYTDSLSLPEVTITANYAIYYERQRLWEAKGNVVVIRRDREEGDTAVTGLTEVYTQQLFWNATTKKIYSNVDTKVLQADGWHFGVGFDADDDLKNIHFRRYSSEIEFDFSQSQQSDTTKRDVIKMAREESAERDSWGDNKGNKGNNGVKDAPNGKLKSEHTRPAFITPTPSGGNAVRSAEQMKPMGTMQLNGSDLNPNSMATERAKRQESLPVRNASKQNMVVDKSSKVELNASANGEAVVSEL